MPKQKNKNRISLLLIFTALTSPASPLPARDYYLSPSGSDTNTGDSQNPFQTIHHAAQAMNPGDNCFLQEGIYRQTLRPNNSGQKDTPLTFKASPGEKVLLSALDLIQQQWTPLKEDLYSCKLDWPMYPNGQLFIDGQPAQLARWPNNSDNNWQTHDAIKYDSGGPNWIACDKLPDSFNNDDLKNTVIWIMAGRKWTGFTSTITHYDPAQKKLYFTKPLTDWVQIYMNPGHKNGGYFYLTAISALIDQPREYAYDPAAKTLYIMMPQGQNPKDHTIEINQRKYAIDLTDRQYIHITGIDILAGSINMKNSQYCQIADIRANHIYFNPGGQTDYLLYETSGIYITGTGNTLRDSEIAFSAGNGIHLGGQRNAVINSFIHDTDTIGAYPAAIQLRGNQNLISHCTIAYSGRDTIHAQGREHLIQYNDIHHAGVLCQDLGLYYTIGEDGQNTEIHHNWLHDNEYDRYRSGIYLDNFSSHFLIHHNLVWNISGNSLHLNKPSQYNFAYHNTLFGNLLAWGQTNKPDSMAGDLLINNLIVGESIDHPDLFFSHNIFLDPKQTAFTWKQAQASPDQPGIDQAALLPGITQEYHGNAPDCGAYEYGCQPWKPGHNFTQYPQPTYQVSKNPYKNRITNGSFDDHQKEQENQEQTQPIEQLLAPWTIINNPPQLLKNTIEQRDNLPSEQLVAMIRSGLCLTGPQTQGIAQQSTKLPSNTCFQLTAWLRNQDAQTIRLAVKGQYTPEKTLDITEKKWTRAVLEFTTADQPETVTVYILKTGPGKAFADDIALMPKWEK